MLSCNLSGLKPTRDEGVLSSNDSSDTLLSALGKAMKEPMTHLSNNRKLKTKTEVSKDFVVIVTQASHRFGTMQLIISYEKHALASLRLHHRQLQVTAKEIKCTSVGTERGNLFPSLLGILSLQRHIVNEEADL